MTTVIRPTLAFIDDDERILRAMNLMFRDSYNVFITTDPDAYLDYIRFNLVHVAISDQRMPSRLGVDILREIKDISPFTMRILLTGYADLEAIIGSINEGEIFRYLIKPCKKEEIQTVIAQAVAIAQANFSQARATTAMPLPMENDYLTTMVGMLNGISDMSAPVPDSPAVIDNPTVSPASEISHQQATASPLVTPNSPNLATSKPAVSDDSDASELENLLLIDDNLEIKNSIERQLAHKYHLLYAQTLEQAYEHLAHNTIGVCITDVMVNGENITPLIYTLKQNNPSLVVMVQTEFQDGATLIELINKGQIFRCLPKPIRISLLEVSVTRAFEYHNKLRNNALLAQRHSVDMNKVEETEADLSPTLKKMLGKLRLKFA